jgi:hypothetical protein
MLWLLLASSTPQIQVDAGRFNPANFPQAIKIERRMPHAAMTARVEKVLATRECSIPGQTKTAFDITVPFAMMMDGSGQTSRIVVAEINCPKIERLVGQIASQLVTGRNLRPSHEGGERWYISEVNFTRGSQDAPTSGQDMDKVVCKQAEPKIGSRVAMSRICKSLAEWRAFEADRDRMRRDLQDTGKHGRME